MREPPIAARAIGLAGLALILAGCPKCEWRVVANAANQTGVTAAVQWGYCGSVEGWKVFLQRPGKKDTTVFMTYFPSDADSSAVDVASLVTVQWSSPKSVVVEYADWLKPVTQLSEFDGVTISSRAVPKPWPPRLPPER